MEKYDIIIAGAGASGMMASISAAREGMKVLLLEKMEKAGKKILITGKGRCNLTNTKEWSEFSRHIYPNPSFFKIAFKTFSNKDVLNFFNEIGVETVIERGDRAYPASGKASDIVKALLSEIERLKVRVQLNSRVCDIVLNEGSVYKVKVESGQGVQEIETSALIVTTGGLSYPLTGSTGDGHYFAKQIGLGVNKTLPSLTAMKPVNFDLSLKGLLLKNVQTKLVVGKDILQEEFGDIEFTNNGFEGPIGLRTSRKAVKAMSDGNRVTLLVDLKPALTEEQLINRIDREFGNQVRIPLDLILKKLLPSQMVPYFIEELKLGRSKILSKTLPGEIYLIVDAIKNWKINIESFTGFERCVVTSGGITLNELVPKTMATRAINNLFFAGEVIDLDGDTGGYNLQIAFSTGNLAGKSAAYLIKKSNTSL